MRTRGNTLIELIIYVALLVVLVGAVVTILTSIVRSYQFVESSLDLERNMIAVDRIVREVQAASLVNEGSSTFDASPGVLVLTMPSGATRTISLSGGAITLSENGGLLGALTSNDVVVTDLIFRYFNGFFSESIQIETTLEAGTGTHYRSETVYTTTVLRGSIDD